MQPYLPERSDIGLIAMKTLPREIAITGGTISATIC